MSIERAGEYKGRIILKIDDVFGAFFSCKKYDSLETIKAAIDNDSINSCFYPEDGTVMTLKNMI